MKVVVVRSSKVVSFFLRKMFHIKKEAEQRLVVYRINCTEKASVGFHTNACFFAALRRWAFPRRPVYLRKGAGQIARLASTALYIVNGLQSVYNKKQNIKNY